MTLGFVVGKFYPPHVGHKYLIDTARQQVDSLIVMLAHHRSQRIPGEVRRQWLQEIHPDCEIHLVPDELDDDSQQWAEFVVKHLGRAPDIVFSSEDYGPSFAAHMGSKHVMVDRDRSSFPISGTKIRAAPLNYLDQLQPCVRAWFVHRVVLVGAESTGKTTLAQCLAEKLRTEWVAEYAREHWESKVRGLKMADPLPFWSSDDFIRIATQQQIRENTAARSANRVLICDTNAFATGTWYERYFGSRNSSVDAIGAKDRIHLYLLTAPDIPFVQDGFRDGEKIRHWMHERFEQQLKVGTTPFVLISGTFKERLAAAVAAIKELGNPQF